MIYDDHDYDYEGLAGPEQVKMLDDIQESGQVRAVGRPGVMHLCV